MISFVLTLKRFLQGFIGAFKNKSFRYIFITISLMLLSGVLFYTKEEGLPVLDALYFCIATLSTVGHPTFQPQTDLGKIFTMIYIVVGTGLFLAMIAHIAYAVFKGRDKEDGKALKDEAGGLRENIRAALKKEEA